MKKKKEDRWREHNKEVEDFTESILFQREEQYDIKELEEVTADVSLIHNTVNTVRAIPNNSVSSFSMEIEPTCTFSKLSNESISNTSIFCIMNEHHLQFEHRIQELNAPPSVLELLW